MIAAFVSVTDAHVVELAERMSPEDLIEVHKLGYGTALEAVRASVDLSMECWTCVLDGEVLAIYGLLPQSVIRGQVNLWMLTTDLAIKRKKSFVRCAKHVLTHLKSQWKAVSVGIAADHDRALRLAARFGFRPQLRYPAPVSGAECVLYQREV